MLAALPADPHHLAITIPNWFVNHTSTRYLYVFNVPYFTTHLCICQINVGVACHLFVGDIPQHFETVTHAKVKLGRDVVSYVTHIDAIY